jgi:hypothetical protein
MMKSGLGWKFDYEVQNGTQIAFISSQKSLLFYFLFLSHFIVDDDSGVIGGVLW